MRSASFYDRYGFGYFSLGNIRFPRLLFGTSPFIGAGQFSDRSVRYYHEFYLNPQNMTRLYSRSISKGLNAIHIPGDPVIVEAICEATRISEVESFILATVEVRDLGEELDLCRRVEADSIITHGSYTDSVGGELSVVLRRIKERFNGVPTGIATHAPGDVLPRVLGVEGVDLIMAPVNLKGEFMRPDRESTLDVIAEARRRGKRVIAMKPLAAGLLTPTEAFNYIVEKVDGVAVGVTSERELDDVLEAASKYFL